eukprot:gnl/TRDRNA2_/TRDRNA2_82238_c0_seq1.p1 gnl/TRDRNA2_/TRDRNA2_82238_c0~~gnl/TRDRNA2_/TRDRNA2_82238_c0_seq1.p1  ORF type:complete len:193 (-),score=14.18 gnl/TRDRNA2_/TRDRNA2_82238_c0_seq1:614-1192(-)
MATMMWLFTNFIVPTAGLHLRASPDEKVLPIVLLPLAGGLKKQNISREAQDLNREQYMRNHFVWLEHGTLEEAPERSSPIEGVSDLSPQKAHLALQALSDGLSFDHFRSQQRTIELVGSDPTRTDEYDSEDNKRLESVTPPATHMRMSQFINEEVLTNKSKWYYKMENHEPEGKFYKRYITILRHALRESRA